ncbi:MAG: tRNA (N6-threonylcarbamoyladenosine(37)-N6)-methyltransferase TrmO [Oscillospiraceae bacterium]|nr:tRNA (N6-threonylcarbamoyladenosine(37)-N6)-methyltransferase TrmO [Oscillospiraceae bacterium]
MPDSLTVVARIRTDFPEKFGLPRQTGLGSEITGRIVFEKPYDTPDALRGIEQFSHLWLIWGFSGVPERENFEPLVRPPRLGGNERVGVFASRSPFRPNRLGLSLVRLEAVAEEDGRAQLVVSGVDLMDGTPIYDIKPYLPYAEAIPDARGGFADAHSGDSLAVCFPPELLHQIPEEKRPALLQALSLDPRPAYQDDPERIYGFYFAGHNVRFRVEAHRLTVISV